MTRIAVLVVLILGFSEMVMAQKPAENVDEFEETYKRRIAKDILYGVYIPKDLGDAFVQLNKLIDKESKEKFKLLPEDQLNNKLFFSFGRWMIHNWGFYGGSRLSHFIKGLGIHHPEDMAKFIMITYHRNLHRKPLDVKNLLKSFHAEQEKEKEELIKKGEILYEEKRLRDTLGGN